MGRAKRYSRGTVGLVIFAAVMTPLLVGLGMWQLSRAGEKEALIEQQEKGYQEENINLTNLASVDWKTQTKPADVWNYKQVEVTGHYDKNVYLLLDNRTRNGNVGYEVINLFRAGDGKGIWVNRGWVKAPVYRDQWPSIASVSGDVDITGTIYFKHEKDFTLADNHVLSTWPRRIQSFDIHMLAAELKSDLYPFTLRLIDDEQPGALQTGWSIPTMSPEKHFGYAFQWFSLATVLVVMTVIAIGKNNTNEVEQTYDA